MIGESGCAMDAMKLPDDVVERVTQMESCYDTLLNAAEQGTEAFCEETVQAQLQRLLAYYEGGQWLEDYLLDEQGYFPAGMKRGVLSQDGVFNLLAELDGWLEANPEEAYL